MGRFSIVRFGVVKVDGPSMEPALGSGDWLLVRWFPEGKTVRKSITPRHHVVRAGDVVVIEREVQPGIFYIKRVKQTEEKKASASNGVGSQINQYWVEGDNPVGTDSRSWGWLGESEIGGKVLFRYKKSKIS